MSTHVYVLLFPGFEHLDADAPLTVFARLPNIIVTTVGYPAAGAIPGANSGVKWVADIALADVVLDPPPINWLLIPGGMGTRALVNDGTAMALLASITQHADVCLSVCTGSALLAAAGCLDGHKATSNKRAWPWVHTQGQGQVQWQYAARWVVSGKYWTSSGVAAGMDMALAFIAQCPQHGPEKAKALADEIEYEGHFDDATWDPFAALYQHDVQEHDAPPRKNH